MADATKTMGFQEWFSKARAAPENEEYSSQQLSTYWLDRYGSRPDAPAVEQPGIMGDTGTALKIGWHGMGQSARGVFRTILPDSVFQLIDSFDAPQATPEERDQMWQVKSQALEDGFSERAKEARAKSWWRDEEEMAAGVGSAFTDPYSIYLALVESAPGTALTMGPTGAIAKRVALGTAEKWMGTQAAKEFEGTVMAKAIAQGAKEGDALTDVVRNAVQMEAGRIGGAAAGRVAYAAGGTLEGLQQGGQSAEMLRNEIERMQPGVLRQSEAFQALVASGMSEVEAKEALKNDVATQAMFTTALATGLFGGAGDRMLARGLGGKLPKSLFGRMGAGALSEGLLEEAPQGFLSQIAENVAFQKADPTRDTMKGAIGQAIGGAVVGGIMGAGIAAPFGGRGPDYSLETAISNVKAAQTHDEVLAAGRQWSEAQRLAVQEQMSAALNQEIPVGDLFPTKAAAEAGVKAAEAMGQRASVGEFETRLGASEFVVRPMGSDEELGRFPSIADARDAFPGRQDITILPAEGLGTKEPGFMVARENQPGMPAGEPGSFAFPTAAAAEGLDPTRSKRVVALTDTGGFTSRAVDWDKVRNNIAALKVSNDASVEHYNKLADKAAAAGDAKQAETLRATAKMAEASTFEPAADPKDGWAVRGLADTVGVDLQYVKISEGGFRFNGRVLESQGRRVLYLNADATAPHLQLAGHEITHRFEASNPKAYAELRDALVPLMSPEARAEITERYGKTGLEGDALTKELVGDIVGTELTNKDLWKALAKKNPTLFGRLAEKIKAVLEEIIAAITGGRLRNINPTMAGDLKKAHKAIAEALDTMAKDTLVERQAAAKATGEQVAGAMDGIMVKIPVVVAETGKEATIEVDAGQEMRNLAEREKSLLALRECLTK